MSLLWFHSRTKHSVLYPYDKNAVRLLYQYKYSLGAREAYKKTEKDINNCFHRLNYLACKRGMKLNLFRSFNFWLLNWYFLGVDINCCHSHTDKTRVPFIIL